MRNHPFLDGNKRTAVLALAAFYGLNALEFTAGDSDLVALALDVAEGILDVPAISKPLSAWTRSLDLDQQEEEV